MIIPDDSTVAELIEKLKELPQELIVTTVLIEVEEVHNNNMALFDLIYMNVTSKAAAQLLQIRKKQ